MLEKLKSFLRPLQSQFTRYAAPTRAIRVGPVIDEIPYMFVWYEQIKYGTDKKAVQRVALEFRNAPTHVIKFDARAIPDLITALTQLQEEIVKHD